ncbi:MAG: porin [Roseibium sp.]|nr:porin [Roseibium sp.]
MFSNRLPVFLAALFGGAMSSAQGADLPIAPEPIDYVQVCNTYGLRYFYLPGTEICLKIGGRVRADFRVANFGDSPNGWDADTDASTQFRARGYLNLDARTNTEFGLLRTYTSMWFTNTTGAGNPAGSDARVTMEYAFIQFGGLTAGRADSVFDFWEGYALDMQIETYSDEEVNLFSYTADFGNGLSATLSLEDGTQRRQPIAGVGSLVSANLYGGHKWPDLVGAVAVDQAWGSAQVMGALHHVYVNGSTTAATANGTLGWAIGAGVEIKAGRLFGGGGTMLALQGSYTDGASGFGTTGWNGRITDAVVVNGSNLNTTKTWNVFGGIRQPLTETVTVNLDAGYHNVEGGTSAFDFTQLDVTPNITWQPVPGLLFGGEVQFRDLDFSGASGLSDRNEIYGTFRIQRTF